MKYETCSASIEDVYNETEALITLLDDIIENADSDDENLERYRHAQCVLMCLNGAAMCKNVSHPENRKIADAVRILENCVLPRISDEYEKALVHWVIFLAQMGMR